MENASPKHLLLVKVVFDGRWHSLLVRGTRCEAWCTCPSVDRSMSNQVKSSKRNQRRIPARYGDGCARSLAATCDNHTLNRRVCSLLATDNDNVLARELVSHPAQHEQASSAESTLNQSRLLGIDPFRLLDRRDESPTVSHPQMTRWPGTPLDRQVTQAPDAQKRRQRIISVL